MLADLKKERGGKERKRVPLALSFCNHKSQEVEWQCTARVLLLSGWSLTRSPAGCIQSCCPVVRENSTGAGAAPVAAVVAEVAVAAARGVCLEGEVPNPVGRVAYPSRTDRKWIPPRKGNQTR